MKPLAKKQFTSNDMWLETINNIESLVSEEEIKLAAESVIEELQKTAGNKKSRRHFFMENKMIKQLYYLIVLKNQSGFYFIKNFL